MRRRAPRCRCEVGGLLRRCSRRGTFEGVLAERVDAAGVVQAERPDVVDLAQPALGGPRGVDLVPSWVPRGALGCTRVSAGPAGHGTHTSTRHSHDARRRTRAAAETSCPGPARVAAIGSRAAFDRALAQDQQHARDHADVVGGLLVVKLGAALGEQLSRWLDCTPNACLARSSRAWTRAPGS
jgi:hypothetical protein